MTNFKIKTENLGKIIFKTLKKVFDFFSFSGKMKGNRKVSFKNQKRKRIIINTKKAPSAIGPYNQVIRFLTDNDR